MTEPRSIKTEPFSDFPRQAYSIMSDDFCHEKKFVAKFTAKTKKSVVKIKEALSYKKDGYSLDDEVKLWFDLPNSGSLYTKLKSTDYVKIHYDHGLREFGPNKFWNLYTSFNSNKSFQNVSLKLGVGVVAEACVSDNRIKLAMESKNSNHWYWYHRTLVTKDKFNFGLLGVFDLTHKVIQKNNLLLGYAYN